MKSLTEYKKEKLDNFARLNGECEWIFAQEMDDVAYYDTACGQAFCDEYDCLIEEYNYCPSCGKKIKEVENER